MSYDTHKNWVYQLVGRDIHLWQYVEAAATDTLGSYKIRLPDEYYGKQLIYPDEDITSGLRVEYTALIEPFVDEAWEDLTGRAGGTNISFTAATTISVTSSTSFSSFEIGDKIRIQGSSSNDGDYAVSNITSSSIGGTSYSDNNLIVSSGITTEAASESINIYQIPDEDTTPDETNHVNLNKMLSLAVVDYIKAQLSEASGSIDLKEYYMREFWKKVGDNESNKRKISMTFPISPFGVR